MYKQDIQSELQCNSFNVKLYNKNFQYYQYLIDLPILAINRNESKHNPYSFQPTTEIKHNSYGLKYLK